MPPPQPAHSPASDRATRSPGRSPTTSPAHPDPRSPRHSRPRPALPRASPRATPRWSPVARRGASRYPRSPQPGRPNRPTPKRATAPPSGACRGGSMPPIRAPVPQPTSCRHPRDAPAPRTPRPDHTRPGRRDTPGRTRPGPPGPAPPPRTPTRARDTSDRHHEPSEPEEREEALHRVTPPRRPDPAIISRGCDTHSSRSAMDVGDARRPGTRCPRPRPGFDAKGAVCAPRRTNREVGWGV